MFIYKITNMINEDFYVGKTHIDVTYRFNQHIKSSLTPKTHLHNAIRKYGAENFMITILDETDDKDILSDLERKWILELKPIYNMTFGGEGGDTFIGCNEEQRDIRKQNISNGITKMWNEMSKEERSRRGIKTKNNTDQEAKGIKISLARKELFANETPECKEARISKNRMTLLKTKMIKKPCFHCNKEIDIANHGRHEKSCLINMNAPKRKTYFYALSDPHNKVHHTNSLKRFCLANNLSAYLLKKNIGKTVTTLGSNSNNLTETSYSTIGWTLLSVSLSD